LRRSISALLLVLAAHFGDAVAQEVNGAPRISDVRLLRKLGQYDQALGYLKTMLADQATSEEVRKQAYNELVTIAYLTKGRSNAEATAREALMAFPDLKADPNDYPGSIQLIYEDLRKSIFGRLSVSSDPSPCDVYLDGKGIGATPLDSVFIPAGEHALRISRSGYQESALEIKVPPGVVTERFVALPVVSTVPKIGIGVELGPSLEMLSYSGETEQPVAGLGTVRGYSAVARFGGSVFLHLNWHDKLDGLAGVRYSSRGNRAIYAMSSGYPSGEYDLYLNYVSAYVLARYHLGQLPGVFLSAGPEFGYLIGAHLSRTTGSSPIDITDQVERFQVALVLGAGYEKGFGGHCFVLSAYHTMGLMSLRNTSHQYESDFKPREWRLSIGFMFD